MSMPKRRIFDSGPGNNASTWADRYKHFWEPGAVRCPRWGDQVVQFVTRYVFAALGIVFFNISSDAALQPLLIPLDALNYCFAVYLVLNSAFFFHAYRQPYSPVRFRAAMWVDVALVAVALLNDPYVIPPSMLVFTMIVLGNGMRYGMRMFGEALLASLAAIMFGLTLRMAMGVHLMSLGVLFLNLFGAIILIYAYALMSRVEQSRRLDERRGRQDSLTGLLNRRALENFAEFLFSRLDRGEPAFVIMLADLDRFKRINDTHGHSAGDAVLRRIGGILQSSVRSSDIVARYGGDEFVVLLEQSDLDRAAVVAARIQSAVFAYSRDAGFDIGVTIGLGRAPDHGQNLESVLRAVDRALYDSKSDDNCAGIRRVELAEAAVSV